MKFRFWRKRKPSPQPVIEDRVTVYRIGKALGVPHMQKFYHFARTQGFDSPLTMDEAQALAAAWLKRTNPRDWPL